MSLTLGQRVQTYIAPGAAVTGKIHGVFNYRGAVFFLIVYDAGGEDTFVVRKQTQFTIVEDGT